MTNEDEGERPRKKVKENPTIAYLRGKNEKVFELRQRELDLKEKELNLAKGKNEENVNFNTHLLELNKKVENQQTVFQTTMLQMQQQQNEMMKLLLTRNEK